MSSPKHREVVRQTLRAEKARRGVTFQQLSDRLSEYGIEQSATNLSTKVGRGVMDAGLFLAILDVLGVDRINIPDLLADIRSRSSSKT